MDNEPVFAASFFEDTEKEIAAFGGVQQRPAAITIARDKVQVVRSVVAVQAFGHYGTGLSARRCWLAVTELQSRLWESHSFAKYANEWGTRHFSSGSD